MNHQRPPRCVDCKHYRADPKMFCYDRAAFSYNSQCRRFVDYNKVHGGIQYLAPIVARKFPEKCGHEGWGFEASASHWLTKRAKHGLLVAYPTLIGASLVAWIAFRVF